MMPLITQATLMYQSVQYSTGTLGAPLHLCKETFSITDCNVKHNIAMLHRRCVRHIFQDVTSKRLSRACWLHLNSSQIPTQVNFSNKVQEKPLYQQYHVGHSHPGFSEHKCNREVQFLVLIKGLGYGKSLVCQQWLSTQHTVHWDLTQLQEATQRGACLKLFCY